MNKKDTKRTTTNIVDAILSKRNPQSKYNVPT
jgi:hypothetical protein